MDDSGTVGGDHQHHLTRCGRDRLGPHHLAYNCSFPVAEWATDGRAVTERPVVSAGQYGDEPQPARLHRRRRDRRGLGQDAGASPSREPGCDESEHGALPGGPDRRGRSSRPPKTPPLTLGAVPLGDRSPATFNRAQPRSNAAGARIENRGGESTLGNLVAEVQQWATEAPESGAAQIAFMNPGGLRADMVGVDPGDGSYPRVLTYKEAAGVQPFANTLVNMQLTGAQIKTVLEQQWQRDALNSRRPRGLSCGSAFPRASSTRTRSSRHRAAPRQPVDTRGRVPHAVPGAQRAP